MNTFTKNMNPSKKNLIAMAEHTISAIVGIMVILGQFFKSLDNDFWVYMLIFVALFSTEFAFNSEEEKKRKKICYNRYNRNTCFNRILRCLQGYMDTQCTQLVSVLRNSSCNS